MIRGRDAWLDRGRDGVMKGFMDRLLDGVLVLMQYLFLPW